MRYVLKTVVLGLALVIGLSATACQHKTPEQRAEWMAKKITRELNLNDEQKTKLEAVKQEFLSVRSQMQGQHDAMFTEGLAQVRSERIEEAKMLQLFQQHQEQVTQLAPSVLSKIAEFHASLTPEQRVKAAEGLQEFHDKLMRH